MILEETRYDYQKGLSDISGWDIHAHDGDYIKIVRIVRDWLVREATAKPVGAAKIQGNYAAFQEWYWDREKDRGASDEDIRAYPTIQVIASMQDWVKAGRPT